MLKKIILTSLGLIAFAIIFVFSMDWGTVKSEIKKTDYVFKENIIYDLNLFDVGKYKASTQQKDNLELLFNIEGLKKTTGRFNDVKVSLEVKPIRKESILIVDTDVNLVFTNNKMRDEALVSDEFFNASKYPKITFVSDSLILEKKSMNAYGKLTFMGNTNPLEFPFSFLGKTIKNNQTLYVVGGRFDFDRTKFGMPHETGVGDIVSISFYVDLKPSN